MGGRVKYKSPARGKKSGHSRKLAARMAAQPPPTSTGALGLTYTNQHIGLDKNAIVWLTILSLIVLGTIAVVIWLLFGRKCRKRKSKPRNAAGHSHHSSLEVTDGRNEFAAWNPNAARRDTGNSEHSLAPLVPSTTKPAGVVHPGEPVVVEDIPLTSLYEGNKRPRYYSGLNSAWKRVSGIGKAV